MQSFDSLVSLEDIDSSDFLSEQDPRKAPGSLWEPQDWAAL